MLHEDAKNAGVTILNECGLDPGKYFIFIFYLFIYLVAFSLIKKSHD